MKTKTILAAALVISMIVSLLQFGSGAASAETGTVNIVALGDSYTSGNGALEYGNDGCYRSSNAYIQQYADLVRASDQVVNASNLACHGAETEHISGQVSTAGSTLSGADIVLLTIGGNDANFVDIVINCLAPVSRLLLLCHDNINTARDGMDDIVSDIRSALLSVGSAAPDAEIVLIGYPYLIAKDCFADADIVRSLQAAADTKMFLMVHELQEQGHDNISFMSLLVPFAGGEVCGESAKLIRGAFDTPDHNEWYHPNVEGHAVIAQELFNLGLHDQFVGPVYSTPPPSPVYQLPPPTSGEPVYSGLPFECGYVVPFASTYDSYNYNGTVFRHGLAIDMPMSSGTSVIAPESGTVYVRSDPYGYGKYIDLHGDSGVIHRMAHLQSTAVGSGARVGKSRILGYVGSTGASTGPHLHYEQRNSDGQVQINLGGPELQWLSGLDSSGYRTTAHSLVSGNCGSAPARSRFEDIITLSYNHFAYGRSDGYDRNGWGTVKQNVFTPTSVDSCDFDGDGYDEYIVLDASTGRVMIADPKGSPNGHFYWRKIGTTYSARKIVCGDWNNDGLDDVMMHNTKNVIYYGRSNGVKIVEWKVARLKAGSRPTYWDMCDINGDGDDDLVTYHAGTKRILVGYRASGVTMYRKEIKGNIGNVGGFTCGNFKAGGSEEIILWNAGSNGRFILARFDLKYRITSWYAFNRTGIPKPYRGEMAAGDVDGDGVDEIFVNIYRASTDSHVIAIADIQSTKEFKWYAFKRDMQASFLAVGEFVK